MAAPAAPSAKAGPKSRGKYTSTVLTPKTSLPQRACDPATLLAHWEATDARGVTLRANQDRKGSAFVLHDGPPYANGKVHVGHMLNKTLKDTVNRFRLACGDDVHFRPGSDCHGLPCELAALRSVPLAERAQLSPLDVRKLAHGVADEASKVQMAAFRQMGVWADWARPYRTFDPEFEAMELRVLARLVQNEQVHYGRWPVHYSPSSGTVLAFSELVYKESTSLAVWAVFPLLPEGKGTQDPAGLVVWTTTPWSLAANAAVAVAPDAEYVFARAVPTADTPEHAHRAVARTPLLVVAREQLSKAAAHCKLELVPERVCRGADLVGLTYAPVDTVSVAGSEQGDAEAAVLRVVAADFVDPASGTGLLHVAPGHGPEDFVLGQKEGLECVVVVDDAGLMTLGPEAGVHYKKAATLVAQRLSACGGLLVQEKFVHKVPHDWRTKEPVLVRAMKQWFVKLTPELLGGAKQNAESGCEWLPSSGGARLVGMLETRGGSDWCVTRQRPWGVPVPAFYYKDTSEPLLEADVVLHVAELVEAGGSDVWWTLSVEELLPEKWRHLAPELVKGTDTLDVWFDSGCSWSLLPQQRSDLVVEGTDQARGWFQSSLLLSTAANEPSCAPFKRVLTHGFVLNEDGTPQSKSGKCVDPMPLVQKQPDLVRLVFLTSSFTDDVKFGDEQLKRVTPTYLRFRGLLRFLLGVLGDFDPAAHAVPFRDLPLVDRETLWRLAEVRDSVHQVYEALQFTSVVSELVGYANDLSAGYATSAKGRLYFELPDHPARRQAQTVGWELLKTLLGLLTPATPFLCDEVLLHMPPPLRAGLARGEAEVVTTVQVGFPDPREFTGDRQGDFGDGWSKLDSLRDTGNQALEKLRSRQAGRLSSNVKLEVCTASVVGSDAGLTLLHKLQSVRDHNVHDADALPNVLGFATVELVSELVDKDDGADGADGEQLAVTATVNGWPQVQVRVSEWLDVQRCDRCRTFHPRLTGDLCSRCESVVNAVSV